jgi:hypothetical protein
MCILTGLAYGCCLLGDDVVSQVVYFGDCHYNCRESSQSSVDRDGLKTEYLDEGLYTCEPYQVPVLILGKYIYIYRRQT